MKVLFFAQLRAVCGTGEAEVEANDLNDAALWELLVKRWPRLAVHRSSVRLARNGAYARDGEIFTEEDEVALIPPVSGG